MTMVVLAVISPEQTKILGVVVVMVTAFVAAVLYPIARAYARRLEGRGPSPDTTRYLEQLSARVERVEAEQERLLELENRLDFAERLLSRGSQPAERIDTPPEPVAGQR